MAKTDLTAQQLREHLHYDPATGIFTRLKKTARPAIVGSVAGTVTTGGYRRIGIDGKKYKEHRLAWFYFYGCWPKNHIDHIDGNPSNNSISNLRDVTSSVNAQNQKKATARNLSTGLLGTSASGKRWQAMIQVNKVTTHLGFFNTPELAHDAYLRAKRKMHIGCTI